MKLAGVSSSDLSVEALVMDFDLVVKKVIIVSFGLLLFVGII